MTREEYKFVKGRQETREMRWKPRNFIFICSYVLREAADQADWHSGNALDSFEGDGFESLPRRLLSWLRFLMVFLTPSIQIP